MTAPPSGLTACEERVWEAFRRGERLDLRPPGAGPAPAVPGGGAPGRGVPGGAPSWGPERTVRASVLTRLLLAPPDPEPGHTCALRLTGARVTGRLSVGTGQVGVYVALLHCVFDDVITLDDATLRTWKLMQSYVPQVRARRARVDGNLNITSCVVVRGVNLNDARVDTDLCLDGSRIGPDERGTAVFAHGAQVGSDVLIEQARLDGLVSLYGARIGGRATFYGTTIATPGATALDARRLTAEHTLHLSDGFTAHGSLRLNDARLGGAVVLDGARVCAAEDEELTAWRMTASGLHLRLSRPPLGRIVLNGATIGTVTDEPGSWPPPGRLGLTGLQYTDLRSSSRSAEPVTPEQRLDWVARGTAEYAPQPYEQLAAFHRSVGEDAAARTVLLARERRRRATLTAPGRAWGWVQDAAIGYGYRPARAVGWLALLVAAGTALFAADRPEPVKADEAPHWSPFFYTLDLLLPVVSLGQDAAWRPDGAAQWAAYALMLVGWVLAGAVAAGATRVINRG